ncbi:MAG: hypothetical protein N3G20_08095 [Verrucomicrobiae bacterium]|nr:hypothetical protein [Verrucomicrobiae bacterium]
MLETALQSSSIQVLVLTALMLGFLHTIMGPDHYVPFIALGRASHWHWTKTIVVALVCGLGHVLSSVLIAVLLIRLGTAVSQWEGTSWARIHEARGTVSAVALMVFGIAYAAWGVRHALHTKSGTHSHPHVHPDGSLHDHVHAHRGDHVHVHGSPAKITPWVIFTIFVFGPCESLIPLTLAAWGLGGTGAAFLTAAAFTATTVLTMVAVVGLLLLGLSRVQFGQLERWTHALAGVSLFACGAAIQFLGL